MSAGCLVCAGLAQPGLASSSPAKFGFSEGGDITARQLCLCSISIVKLSCAGGSVVQLHQFAVIVLSTIHCMSQNVSRYVCIQIRLYTFPKQLGR